MKISEFVIVIDTSYSTNGPLVKRFLEETFQIIRQRDSFFRKSHIRIIQCDNQVHTDTIIRSQEDIDRLLQNFSSSEAAAPISVRLSPMSTGCWTKASFTT